MNIGTFYSDNIDKKILEAVEIARQPCINIKDQDFADGYCAFIYKDSDPYLTALPKNSPKRLCRKINDVETSRELMNIYEKILELSHEFQQENVRIESISQDSYGVMLGKFKDEHTAYLFHAVVTAIDQMRRYLQVKSFAQMPCVPEGVIPFYDINEGIVDITDGAIKHSAITFNCTDVAMIPTVFDDNCSLWEKLQDHVGDKDFRVKVRPSRFLPMHEVPCLSPAMEEHIWGKRFCEESLRKLIKKEPGKYDYCGIDEIGRRTLVPLRELQYVMEPKDKGRTVSIMVEELIDINYGPSMRDVKDFIFGTDKRYYVRHRLIHFMCDKDSLECKHLDLSYLYYDQDAYKARLSQTFAKIMTKATIKNKVFRLDGIIPYDVVANLIGLAFDAAHNPEVENFLEGR